MADERITSMDIWEMLYVVLELNGDEDDDVVEESLADRYNISIDDFQEIAQKLYDCISLSYSDLSEKIYVGFADTNFWMVKKEYTSNFINVLIDWMGRPTSKAPKYERIITKEGKPDYRVVLEKLPEEESYLVWTKNYVGNSLIFWRQGRAGYTTDMDKAHRFTYEEAKKIQDGCHGDHQLIALSHLNAIATRQVHSDHLDRSLVGKEVKDV